MMPANLALSAKELELVNNTDWILTKHAIIDKVYALYGHLLPQMQQHLQHQLHNLPDVLRQQSPKIAKGEHYQRLPYVMADYPRLFTKEDTLAIRMLFWWGHFFSINLQVSGQYQAAVAERLLADRQLLCTGEYWIGVGATPWEHHFEEDNFKNIGSLSEDEFAAILFNRPFIKLAKKIPLTRWGAASNFLWQSFIEISQWLTNQAPRR